MSLRYRLFGIPKTFDEFVDSAISDEVVDINAFTEPGYICE